MSDDPAPYMLINWPADCARLKTAAQYLAVVSEDGVSCTVVRVIDPSEAADIRERIAARNLHKPPPQPIAQARAQAATTRTPPTEGKGLFYGRRDSR